VVACFVLLLFALLCVIMFKGLRGPHCPRTGEGMRVMAIGNAFIYHKLRHLRPPILNNDVINMGYIHSLRHIHSTLNVIWQ
jgi:hypothetical protein